MVATNLDLDMFSLFEMTPDLVCIAGKDGFFQKINPAVVSKLGYTMEELFSRPISSFIHPDDRELTGRKREKLLSGEPLLNFQNRYLKKDGTIVWLQWTSIFLPDKEIVFAIAKDITESKLVEQEIEEKYKKFKSLASHFKVSLEKNRKYVAVELHEELAQLAAVVKMDLDFIRTTETSLSHVAEKRLEHALAVCSLLINTIRRISFSISPNMLDDIGLNATLEWHCKEFTVLNGIPCSFQAAYNEHHLSEEVRLDFFRICQETLTNIMCHANANNVQISIEDLGKKIALSITDDGKGFDLKKKKETFGLTHIEKLVVSINGDLKIGSRPGEGTKITVTVPKTSKIKTD